MSFLAWFQIGLKPRSVRDSPPAADNLARGLFAGRNGAQWDGPDASCPESDGSDAGGISCSKDASRSHLQPWQSGVSLGIRATTAKTPFGTP